MPPYLPEGFGFGQISAVCYFPTHTRDRASKGTALPATWTLEMRSRLMYQTFYASSIIYTVLKPNLAYNFPWLSGRRLCAFTRIPVHDPPNQTPMGIVADKLLGGITGYHGKLDWHNLNWPYKHSKPAQEYSNQETWLSRILLLFETPTSTADCAKSLASIVAAYIKDSINTKRWPEITKKWSIREKTRPARPWLATLNWTRWFVLMMGIKTILHLKQ